MFTKIPTCNIYLCRVPITPLNQLDFSSVEDQENYFASKVIHEFENCHYQPRNTVIKLKGYVDELQDANYGYFDNEYNGKTKRFYFWIAEKNYHNKGVTDITIQIDVWQTWLFDIEYTPCFIERCHLNTDNIGDTTYPEDFELGDYVTGFKWWSEDTCGDMCYCLATTETFTSEYDDAAMNGEIEAPGEDDDTQYTSESRGGIFGKTFCGYDIVLFRHGDDEKLSNYIASLCKIGKGDAIAFIFMYPEKLLAEWEKTCDVIGGTSVIDGGKQVIHFDKNLIKNFNFNGNTYTPYNKKLYTYPYNFLTVTAPDGSNVIWKLENFRDINNIVFQLDTLLTKNPTFELVPLDYNGVNYSYSDTISMAPFGLCSWNNDNYANWYAQHQHSIGAQSANAKMSFRANAAVAENNYQNSLDNNNTNMYKGAINTANNAINALGSFNFLGAASNGISGAATTYLDYKQGQRNAANENVNTNLLNKTNYQNTIRGLMASVKDAAVQPNTCKGDTSSCGLDAARDTACFYIKQTYIKPEYAHRIDLYFQKYGYKINYVGKPTPARRKKWDYIKTVDCNIYGKIPFEDTLEINNLFNNGFTVWHDASYMFNYDQENPIR